MTWKGFAPCYEGQCLVLKGVGQMTGTLIFFTLSPFSVMLIELILEVLGFIVIEDILDKKP
jgi:hypothetical protein